MAEPTHLAYIAAPTLARFHKSPARVRGVRGPVGSGKSCAMCMELFRLACEQAPYQGVRRWRGVAIRNSYPELKSTTIKTWLDWFGDLGTMHWSAPITFTMRLRLPDQTLLDFELLFLSMDKPRDVKKLKSLEVTAGWLNEASELSKTTLDMLDGRIGRYPPMKWGGATRRAILMDTNAMSDDHWWYHLAEVEQPEGFAFFAQPPAIIETAPGQWALHPEAENVAHHAGGAAYWLDQIPGKRREWIRVYLQALYGVIEEGRAVYPEFREDLHLARVPLKPYKGLPLLLAWDFGLHPACLITQVSPRGKLLVLDELTGDGTGIRRFARDVVRSHLSLHYPQHPYHSVGDPSGATGVDTDERSCLMELDEAGFPCAPGATNAFVPRRDAVAGYLGKLVDGEPGLLVSPACKVLIKGFFGAYKFKRLEVTGEARYEDKALKTHPVSDVHDCLQYAALEAQGGVIASAPHPPLPYERYAPADPGVGY